MISDRLYRLLLSSGITFGGLGVAWILMKAIVPSKEEMLKVFTYKSICFGHLGGLSEELDTHLPSKQDIWRVF